MEIICRDIKLNYEKGVLGYYWSLTFEAIINNIPIVREIVWYIDEVKFPNKFFNKERNIKKSMKQSIYKYFKETKVENAREAQILIANDFNNKYEDKEITIKI